MAACQPEKLSLQLELKEGASSSANPGVWSGGVEAHSDDLLSAAPVVESNLDSTGLDKSCRVGSLRDAKERVDILLHEDDSQTVDLPVAVKVR